jgi:hypothetical protein
MQSEMQSGLIRRSKGSDTIAWAALQPMRRARSSPTLPMWLSALPWWTKLTKLTKLHWLLTKLTKLHWLLTKLHSLFGQRRPRGHSA